MKRSAAYALLFLVVIAVVGFLFRGTLASDTPAEPRLHPDNTAMLKRGQQVYQANCAACHGAALEGQPNWRERDASGRLPAPPHDASGHTWHHPDEMLFRLTKYGVAKVAKLENYNSAMPAFEGTLSDEDIIATLSWIKAQWPAEVRAQHDQLNRRAQPAAS